MSERRLRRRVRGASWAFGALLLSACPASEAETVVGEDTGEPDPAVALAPVASVGTADTWIDLLAQRPSAVETRDGRVFVDLGRSNARKHLQLAKNSPWILAEEFDGTRAGLLVGRTGSLSLPLDGALAPAANPADEEARPGLAVAVTLKALVEDQLVTVLWNEQPVVNLRVSDERFERRTVSIPTDAVRPGENQLRLHFRDLGNHGERVGVSAAVASVEVGRRLDIAQGAPEAGAYELTRGHGGVSGVRLPGGSGLTYYLIPPRRGRLRFEAAGSGGLSIRVSTDEDHRRGNAPDELWQRAIRPTGQSVDVDLSGYADVPVRLELVARGQRSTGGVELRRLEVVAPRTVPADRRSRAKRDLYVLAIEGARWDELLRPRNRGPRLETIERLVRDGLVFEHAYALGSAAVPSHAGWLSSIVPPAHLTVRGTFVAESRTLLPEVLDRAGYFNVGVSANTDLDRERGLSQGMDDHRTIRAGRTKINGAPEIVAAVVAQLDVRPRPRFVLANLNDPQAPYDPPRELLGDVEVPEGAPPPHLTHMWLSRVRRNKIEPGEVELSWVKRLYLGELQVVDDALGTLIADLEARGELNSAVIVLVGVHGEEFHEHDRAGHGHSLFDESIRVPLVVHAPELLAPGRVETPVDLLDLAPTMVDLLGLDYPPQWQGESLLPVVDDPLPPPRLAVSYLGDGSRAAIVGRYKLILGPGRGPEALTFYDLRADPGETTDLRETGGVALRMVQTALAWQLLDETGWKRARWGTGVNLRPTFALDQGM